ncbi:MAG: BadF/BadG/BcrA/BcrD ATPase family protein [Acidobacteriota bacterium]
MPLFLAIDAGGTKTRCWIADNRNVLGQSSCGTVKIMTVGEETATLRLQDLVHAAAKSANIDLHSIKRTAVGLAGIGGANTREWAQRTLAALVPGEILISGDEEIALDAAFHRGPGILVIAGTGSNVVGRCADGRRFNAGGWGPMLGDEGSGGWIGLQAIRSALRARDRGIDTCLLREIEAFWELSSLAELVAKANHRPRPDFAELAKVVADCADNGDTLAASVLDRAGEELADQVSLVASKMHAANCPPADSTHVAFTGSVLGKIPRVLRSMEEHLRTTIANVNVAQHAVEPLEGALFRARHG